LKEKSCIKLFANCIPVKGASRGAICDLQRNLFIPVPLSLIQLLDDNNIFHITRIKESLDKQSMDIFKEYIELMEKHELIFCCDANEAKKFPLLNMEWDYPSQISNAIIDIDLESKHDYNAILEENMDAINCRHIQFRHFGESELSFWQEIINIVNSSSIYSVEIILKDTPANFTHAEISTWVFQNRKIQSVTLHSSLENKEIQSKQNEFSGVMSVKESITGVSHCGIIHHAFFASNIESFTESQHHNTCLNRKISIDVNGEIKNCPSMNKSYGNIKDTQLIDVVNNPEFRKVWDIKKDEITKCKDCEFRHICTDCRAYLDDPKDQYSAPLKCGYDPYTCQWEDWSTNPLKEKAIEYYGMQDFVAKED